MKASLPQIRKIQTLRKKMKLDDGEYYGMLESYGAAHCNELPMEMAGKLIETLEKTAVECGVWERKEKGRKYDHLKNREPDMATPAQLRMIEAMWADVSYSPREKLQTALRNLLFTIVKVSDLRFLTCAMVRKVMCALQAMKVSRAKKASSQAA